MTGNVQGNQSATTNSGTGSEPSTASMFEQARQERERMEKLLPQITEERKRLEEAQTRAMLGGQSFAGQGQEPKREISAKEYAESALKGKVLK